MATVTVRDLTPGRSYEYDMWDPEAMALARELRAAPQVVAALQSLHDGINAYLDNRPAWPWSARLAHLEALQQVAEAALRAARGEG